MTDPLASDKHSFDKLTADLTEAERRALRRVLDNIHNDLVRAALRELRLYLFLVFGALTAWGLISWTGLRRDIVDAAAKQYANDPDIRDDLIAKAQDSLTAVNQLAADVADRRKQFDSETATLAGTLANDISEINHMLERLRNK